jgi:hypothetical protein
MGQCTGEWGVIRSTHDKRSIHERVESRRRGREARLVCHKEEPIVYWKRQTVFTIYLFGSGSIVFVDFEPKVGNACRIIQCRIEVVPQGLCSTNKCRDLFGCVSSEDSTSSGSISATSPSVMPLEQNSTLGIFLHIKELEEEFRVSHGKYLICSP